MFLKAFKTKERSTVKKNVKRYHSLNLDFFKSDNLRKRFLRFNIGNRHLLIIKDFLLPLFFQQN